MLKKKSRLWGLAAVLLTVLLCAGLLAPSAAAKTPKRPENQYVLDSADVLSSAVEKHIISGNERLFREYGAEVVVVTVDFLDGEAIDDYAVSLFDDWGIGSRERNNGILLVMAVGEDNYYALSGSGIDDYFDGAMFRALLDDYLEDDFAAGDYGAGAKSFFDAAAAELDSYYASSGGEAGPAGQDYYEEEEHSSFSWMVRAFGRLVGIVIRIVVVLVILAVVLSFFGSFRGGSGGPPGGGGGGGFWRGMLLGSMMGRRRSYWRPPPPPPGPGFGRPPMGPRPGGPRPGGFGGFGGFSGGGRSGSGGAGRSGFGGHSGGFHGGGGTHGGGAGRR